AVTVGERVSRGDALAYLHVHRKADAKPFVQRVLGAFTVKAKRPAPRRLLIERVSTGSARGRRNTHA
ncbi:MAG TPA: hypothetical protein VIV60_13605, partial [Polyangiaceae bacterium]